MSRHPRRAGKAALVLAAALAPAALGAQSPAPAPARPRPPAAPASASFETLSREADAAREAGRLDEAVATYNKALRIKPAWPEGKWYFGTTLYKLGRYDAALRAFSGLVAEQPLNGPAWGFKGLCEFQGKAYETAILDLLKAREIGFGPNKELASVVRYHSGIVLTRFEQFEYALQILSEFAVEGNDNPKVIEAMGTAALRIPSLPEGVAENRRAAVLLAGRGAYYIASQAPQAAGKAFEDLVAQYPDMPNVHYAYGVYLLREEPDKAIEEFKKEIARSPGHVPSILQIAFEYIKRSDWESAKPWAQQAVELAPREFPQRQAYGQVLLELGDVPGAIEQLETGLKVAPESPTLHFTLARAYQKAGRNEEAERERLEFMRLQRQGRTSRSGSQSIGGKPETTPP